MFKKKYANQARLRRHRRVRKKVSGTGLRPRLSVFRSQNQIYAQIVDDERRTTLVAASSREAALTDIAASLGVAPRPSAAAAPGAARAETTPAAPAEGRRKGSARGATQTPAPAAEPASDGAGTPIPEAIANNRRIVQARLVGHLVAQRAKAQGIEKVVFDRGGYLYQGRVAALAAGAREGGLDF